MHKRRRYPSPDCAPPRPAWLELLEASAALAILAASFFACMVLLMALEAV